MPMSKTVITTPEIERVIVLRETHAALKKRLSEVDKDISASESEIIKKLKSPSAENASGFMLKIKTSFKRSVGWKEVVVEKLGKLYAARVLAKCKPTKYLSLVIGAEEAQDRKAA